MHEGERWVEFSASDRGGGIASVGLLVDGHVAVERPAEPGDTRCRTPYIVRVPCPMTATVTVHFDTAALANGSHVVQAFAADVSGNRATSAPFSISTRNAALANGATASRAARLTASVTTVAGTPIRRAVSYGRSAVIRGTLSNLAGVPIAGAQLDVLTRSSRPGAAQRTRVVTTDAMGRFAYRLPTGPSRVVDVAYRAFSLDDGYSATATATLRVRAAIKLTATPRTLRNGQRVRFRGRLVGGPHRQDATILLYALGGRRIPVTSLRADSRGRFSFSYRFRTVAQRSSFRFQVRAERRAGYPYDSGASNVVVSDRAAITERIAFGPMRRLAVCVAMGAALILAPPAWGQGVYTVDSCVMASGAAASSDGWSFSRSGSPSRSCPSPGITANEPRVVTGQLGGFSAAFTVPAPLRIIGYRLWRSVAVAPNWNYTLLEQSSGWPGATIETCWSFNQCSALTGRQTNAAPDITRVGVNLASVTLWVDCNPGPCPGSGQSHVTAHRLQAELRDPSAPTLTAAPSGDLVDTTRPISGVRTISFTAADQGSGVYLAHVEVDGIALASAVVDSNDGRCAKPFLYLVPCRSTASGSVSMDTAQLPDGPHTIRLVVTDATETNSVAYGPVQVTTANRPVACSPGAATNLSLRFATTRRTALTRRGGRAFERHGDTRGRDARDRDHALDPRGSVRRAADRGRDDGHR